MSAVWSSPASAVAGTGEPSVFLAAVEWVQAVLLGPIATSLAVVAVASVGLLMSSGRINVRRGATVIVGCFILFGAATIAQGLRGLAASAVGGEPPPVTVVTAAPLALPAPESPPTLDDPYAGASVRR
ncbi:TrbC/VirB2 family protein [Brevundimonas subvibrioides]|uniref:TrbC/VirB2 family protein n=1 Tax=Brevundimonas subvibrioides TaxID=74313 RepID=UPI0022B443D9|nr:TrbC/VirB2 family protein [Brevundimonas subvibrioides]